MNTRLEIASRILVAMVSNTEMVAASANDPHRLVRCSIEFADALIDHELRTRKHEPPLEKGVDTKS